MARKKTWPKWQDKTFIYGRHYTLCLSKEDLVHVLKDLEVDPDNWPVFDVPNCDAHVSFIKAGDKHSEVAIVCLKNWLKKDGIIIAGLLLHEAVHIFQRWCSDVGEENPGDEVEAYSIQWISQNLMWEFARRVVPA